MSYVNATDVVTSIKNQLIGKIETATLDTYQITDIGKAAEQALGVDPVFKTIMNKVGNTLLENKEYRGKFPALFVTDWEFGEVLETLRVGRAITEADNKYNAVSGGTYDAINKYQAVEVTATYYTKSSGERCKIWRPTNQLWGSFKDAGTMQRFLDGLYLQLRNEVSRNIEAHARTLVLDRIGHVLDKAVPDAQYGNHSSLLAVNILKEYNDTTGDHLTAANALNREEFLRFAINKIKLLHEYMSDLSTQFNNDGVEEQTYAEDIMTILRADVKVNIETYLKSKTYNENMLALPGKIETVTAWQDTKDYDSSVGEVNVKIKNKAGQDKIINATGIIGVMLDPRACMLACPRIETRTDYNVDIDQWLLMESYQVKECNNLSKNFIVFYIADSAA